MCSDMERIIERSKPSWNIKSLTGWRYREEIKAKSWNKNGDVCNYSLNNDLLFLRMSVFFLNCCSNKLTQLKLIFCKFLFFGWRIFIGFFFFSDAAEKFIFCSDAAEKFIFCKFFWLRKRDLHFLKKETLKYRARLVLWTLLLLQYFIQVFQLSRFPFLSVFDLVINQ